MPPKSNGTAVLSGSDSSGSSALRAGIETSLTCLVLMVLNKEVSQAQKTIKEIENKGTV